MNASRSWIDASVQEGTHALWDQQSTRVGWEGGGNSTNAYDSKEAPRNCQEMHVLDVFVQAVASVVLEAFVWA